MDTEERSSMDIELVERSVGTDPKEEIPPQSNLESSPISVMTADQEAADAKLRDEIRSRLSNTSLASGEVEELATNPNLGSEEQPEKTTWAVRIIGVLARLASIFQKVDFFFKLFEGRIPHAARESDNSQDTQALEKKVKRLEQTLKEQMPQAS